MRYARAMHLPYGLQAFGRGWAVCGSWDVRFYQDNKKEELPLWVAPFAQPWDDFRVQF